MEDPDSKYSDGECYQKIREYQGAYGDTNPTLEDLWLSRLPSNKRRDMFHQLSRHAQYLQAFDALLEIPALFENFRLTGIHHLISMKCDELCLSYLKYIYTSWHTICDGSAQKMLNINKETIKALEGTAPGASQADHERLYSQLRSGQIFGDFDRAEREQIWRRVCRISSDCLIPSMLTFFEDVNFLQNVSNSLKRLMSLSKTNTIPSRLAQMFSDSGQKEGQCIIQVLDSTYLEVPGNAQDRLDLGSRQLWLAAFRAYRSLPAEPQRKTALRAKPREECDPLVLYELASLARRLGFQSKEIHTILEVSPDRLVAQRALLSARKPEQFEYDDMESLVQQVVGIFNTARDIGKRPDVKRVQSTLHNTPPRLYGLPHNEDHDNDQLSLFLHVMHRPPEPSFAVTSLFIRRSVYFAFFGRGLSASLENVTSDPIAATNNESQTTRGLTGVLAVEANQPRGGEDLSIDITTDLQMKEQMTLLESLARQEKVLLVRLEDLASREKMLLESVRTTKDRLDQLALEEEERACVDVLTPNETFARKRDLSQATQTNEPSIHISERESSDLLEVASQTPLGQMLPEAKRQKRVTQFRLGGLLETEDNGGQGATFTSEGGWLAEKIQIVFKPRKNGVWKDPRTLQVDPSDPSEVRRVATEFVREGLYLYDDDYNNLSARTCFDQVRAKDSNNILVMTLSEADSLRGKSKIEA